MFDFAINTPSSLYAFLSGILISISTTAFGNVVLAESAPANQGVLLSIGIISLVASFFWLLLSERVVSINLAIERGAASLPGDTWSKRQRATEAVRQDSSRGVYVLTAGSLIFSILWLFPIFLN